MDGYSKAREKTTWPPGRPGGPWSQHGLSVLAVIFVILVLAAVGYAFSTMMAAKQRSVPATLDGARAFYIAEGGLHFAGKYLSGLASWNPVPANQSRNLGGGSFTVSFSNYSAAGGIEQLTVTATGTYGTGTRVLVAVFSRRI